MSRYRKILFRVDGAGATHALLEFFEGLNHAARRVVYTVGWTITPADEKAIAALPEAAWTVAVATSGEATPGYEVAELTGLNTRPGWPPSVFVMHSASHANGRPEDEQLS